MNIAFVFLGIALSAILIIENILLWWTTYIFLASWNWGFLSFVSIIIWIFIWFWLRWMLNKDKLNDEENFDL